MFEQQDNTTPLTLGCGKTQGLLSSRAQRCKAQFHQRFVCVVHRTHLSGLLTRKNIMIPMVLDQLVKIYVSWGNFLSRHRNNTILNCVHVEESHTILGTSWCEFPIHCEKQLHYLLIKSLPLFLHSFQLGVISALNKRLNVDSVLGLCRFFNIHPSLLLRNGPNHTIVPSALIYLV